MHENKRGPAKQRSFENFSELAKASGVPSERRKDTSPSLSVSGVYSSRDLLTRFIVNQRDLGGESFQPTSILPESVVTKARELGDALYARARDTNAKHYNGMFEDIEKLLQSTGTKANFFINRIDVQLSCIATISELPQLKRPYGLKGGAARIGIRSLLGINRNTEPRDIDLVRLGKATREQDRAMSALYMAEDFSFNKRHGVEVLSSVPQYLHRRDFTINEVVYVNGILLCSPQCLFDTIGGIIRPSARQTGRARRKGNLPKNLAGKALRFLAEATAIGQLAETRHFASPPLNDFSLALNLKRTLEQSERTAELFLEAARMAKVLPGCYQPLNAHQLKEKLGRMIKQGPDFFTPFQPDQG